MKVTDPVCGMSLESADAAAQETFQGKVYYFCSARCHEKFKRAPGSFAKPSAESKGCCGGCGH